MKDPLVFNLRTDSEDTVLAFTTGWLAHLADHFAKVHVVTLEAGATHMLPGNVRVHSLGKELGRNDARLLIEFYRLVSKILWQEEVAYAFAHMAPMFAVMAYPLLAVHRVPVITWYTHPTVGRWLPAAHRVSSAMVTFSPDSYPLATGDKVHALGHGIDTELFHLMPYSENGAPIISCVGRISRAKRLDTLIDAASILRHGFGLNFRIEIVGDSHSAADEAFRSELERAVSGHGLNDVVDVQPGVPMRQLPGSYWRSKVHVNLSRTGYGDKVALEAMACGRPSVVASDAFDVTLGDLRQCLKFDYGDPSSLARILAPLLTSMPRQINEVGAILRRRVEDLHDLDGLVEKLVALMRASA